MKKLILLTMCMVLIGASAGVADTIVNFSNNTTVTGSNGSPYVYSSVIGAPNFFNTPGGSYDVTSTLLTINTDWNPGKDNYYSSTGYDIRVQTAFLFVEQGNNKWAINLETGKFFENYQGMQTSKALWGSYQIYGEYISGTEIPVKVTDTSGTNIAVTWKYGNNADRFISINNSFALDLNVLKDFDASGVTFDILWATAQCANGPIQENFPNGAPIPPSALLLGTGLVGLVGLGWRRRQTNR